MQVKQEHDYTYYDTQAEPWIQTILDKSVKDCFGG